MNKKDRQFIFDKFGGKCAYCGEPLVKGWHVDEIEPIRRKYKWQHRNGWYDEKGNRVDVKGYTEDNFPTGLKWLDDGWVADGCKHPERLHLGNQMPSCASCNINKHSMNLEEFRQLISGFMKHLNEISTQYKIAKRYGLVKETGNEVKFYFELLSDAGIEPTRQPS